MIYTITWLYTGLSRQRYFIETIGNANEGVIRQYVQNQLVSMNAHEEAVKQQNLF